MFRNNIYARSISAKISPQETELAKAYIKGAVHSFVKNNPKQKMSVRILFGAENKDWYDTPLQVIYDYYNSKNRVNAKERAAIDVGWLLKTVLAEDDSREYEETTGYTKEYSMV